MTCINAKVTIEKWQRYDYASRLCFPPAFVLYLDGTGSRCRVKIALKMEQVKGAKGEVPRCYADSSDHNAGIKK